MESLNSKKFQQLSIDEMKIVSGGKWKKWRPVNEAFEYVDICDGVETIRTAQSYQAHNRWGLYSTSEF